MEISSPVFFLLKFINSINCSKIYRLSQFFHFERHILKSKRFVLGEKCLELHLQLLNNKLHSRCFKITSKTLLPHKEINLF